MLSFLVTGSSRGYAFVEYETEKDMLHAYEVCVRLNCIFLPLVFVLESCLISSLILYEWRNLQFLFRKHLHGRSVSGN